VASAQDATGTIGGSVLQGTEGAPLGEATVELIMLAGSDVGVAGRTTLVDGAYEFRVPLDPEVRFIPRVVYGGVQYLGEPASLSSETPAVEVDPITVYETTDHIAELSIRETVVTVIAIDRGTGQLGMVREDFVVNPTDRVLAAPTEGATLRIPAPERTVDAAGENADGRFALVDGVLTTTTPMRALNETLLITRWLVEYDIQSDRYVLRITVPVTADRVVVRVPHEYVRRLMPEGDATRAPDEFIETATGDAPLYTAVLEGAGPGDSLVVVLDGLAISVNRNPIAEPPGNVIAATAALLLLAAALAVSVARRRTAEPPAGADS
jgi:hypothetical protein